jgi:predicted DCC family thiol-disulfide oxidoreductase YuxK
MVGRPLSDAAPALPTPAPLIVFDGVCVLCSGFMQWVIRHDPDGQFHFTTAQGPLGQALIKDLGLDPVRLETILLIEGGVAYGKLAAIIAIATRLGGVWRATAVLKLLPGFIGDWVYDRIARNRYALFGKRDVCWTPSPHLTDRVT